MHKRRKSREHKKNTGSGILGFLTGVAATYFFYGTKKGEEKRKEIKGIALKAKEEIIERAQMAEDITEEKYQNIVDEVSERYKNIKNVDTSEIEEMAEEMRGHWKSISKQVMEGKTPRTRKISRKKSK